jgi:alkyl sulfatase BDS1-like metallo-beta-lactamase superfamily hydrolase
LKCAHPKTVDFHRLLAQELAEEDGADFEDARRGFIGSTEHAEVIRPDGHVIWSMRGYGFLEDESPAPTVNPSLWRQARLNMHHGLFEVAPRIYQVRGFDIANISFIEGDTGLVIIDCLQVAESASAALALYRQHRGQRPIHAVIYSHSHADHYGGIHGLVDEQEVRSGRIKLIAPRDFMRATLSENLVAGVAMGRRQQFQFGPTLPKGAAAQVDAGLGKTVARSWPGLMAPNMSIEQDYERHLIDGLEIEFQLTPETEAPSEMHCYFPQLRALNLAENATHNLHNLCPLRGARVRDSLAWSKYLHHALVRWGDRSDLVFAQHHWPTWGGDKVKRFLAEQRDLYRYLHDQTVRLMSHGMKAAEIAELLTLPQGLAQRWHTRGYYGTVSHNVKAIYQHYLSWYDANPANLHALPPGPAASKTMAYMGGIDAVMQRARADYELGEFRWVAEVMKHAVYAHPDRADARELAAQALDQMAFQTESATWRNAFLLGAHEYREGPPKAMGRGPGAPGMLSALPNEMLFDVLAIRINGPRAAGLSCSIGWVFGDSGERWLSTLSHGALSAIQTEGDPGGDAQVHVDRNTLEAIMTQQLAPMAAIAEGRLVVKGRARLLAQFFGLLDRFAGNFPVVDIAPIPA